MPHPAPDAPPEPGFFTPRPRPVPQPVPQPEAWPECIYWALVAQWRRQGHHVPGTSGPGPYAVPATGAVAVPVAGLQERGDPSGLEGERAVAGPGPVTG